MNCWPKMVKEEALVEKVLKQYPKYFKNKQDIQSVLEFMGNELRTIELRGGLIPLEKGRGYYKWWPFYMRIIDEWGFWKVLGILIPILLTILGKRAINRYYDYKIIQIQQNQTINNQFMP